MLVDAADRLDAVGLLVECGQHDLASTKRTALSCSLRAIEYLDLVEIARRDAGTRAARVAEVNEIVKAEGTRVQMVRSFHNFELVQKGTEVFRGAKGGWIAPRDFLILIPAQGWVQPGDDAFAMGEWVSPSQTADGFEGISAGR